MEYVTLALPAAVSRTETPPHGCPGFSRFLPLLLGGGGGVQSPQHTGTQTLGPLPGTPRGPAATWGAWPCHGHRASAGPPPLAAPPDLKQNTTLTFDAGGGGARRRVIFSRDWRKALFLTFTGRHSLTPQPEIGLKRWAGKPPPRQRKPVLSAVPLILRTGGAGRQAGMGLHGWGNSTSFLVSVSHKFGEQRRCGV